MAKGLKTKNFRIEGNEEDGHHFICENCNEETNSAKTILDPDRIITRIYFTPFYSSGIFLRDTYKKQR